MFHKIWIEVHWSLSSFKYFIAEIKPYTNILYNIFGDATTPMLFYKIDKSLWSSIKTFIVFLDKLPDYPKSYIHEIDLDQTCLDALNGITNG